MSPDQYCCGECRGRHFPEGMFVYFCPVCKSYIHPGCWEAHAQRHSENRDNESGKAVEPRRGKIAAYGIVQWDN